MPVGWFFTFAPRVAAETRRPPNRPHRGKRPKVKAARRAARNGR